MQPFTTRNNINSNSDKATLYLPKLKEAFNEAPLVYSNSKNTQISKMPISETLLNNDSQLSTQPAVERYTFDPMFYRRISFLSRIIDEDGIELEKAKNYFRSISEVKSVKVG